VLPLKYKAPKEGSKLKIGYYLSDGLVEPSQACRSAVIMAKDALEEQGHTVVEFNMGSMQKISEGVLRAYVLMCSGG
jgi:Asp-tRNA(Asn)/Glu-tRNA(Gln) amidotransferase A subunit family amidase